MQDARCKIQDAKYKMKAASPKVYAKFKMHNAYVRYVFV
jgi:hypothetical protein